MSVFSIQKPRTRPLPIIFDSPHSGTAYPPDFRPACDPHTLESAEDKFVDELFAAAPDYGAHLLCALFPRSYIDPNRAEDDIDTALFAKGWEKQWAERYPINPTMRSDAGIGLIRRLVKPGVPLYDRHLSPEEIWHRIETYHRPYHAALEKLINDTHYMFGQVWHINCHSMPGASAYPRRPHSLKGHEIRPVDFVLGDRDGTSCSTFLTRALKDFIKSKGYSVSINDPFKGVELVERYSNPARGVHSLQLEINKSLYLHEDNNTRNKQYETVRNDINSILEFTASFVESQLKPMAAD
ncbi:MAG: N-formylglutamate amidohydrolase [Alphaproteobacteria bacterium]|nr:N-formylglutamate amidohydrolase [Alphaproteobacteria bacterium]